SAEAGGDYRASSAAAAAEGRDMRRVRPPQTPAPTTRGARPWALQAFSSLGAGEVLDPEDLVTSGVLAEGEAEADVVEYGREQVIAVRLALHPPVHHLVHRVLSAGDVLPRVFRAIPERLDPFDRGLSLGRVVRVVPAGGHVPGVRPGRVVQPRVPAQPG